MKKVEKVKVYLKPGPWEGEQGQYGTITLKSANSWADLLYHKDHPIIDHIEPCFDAEAAIRDKVPVIGWNEKGGDITDVGRGFAIQGSLGMAIASGDGLTISERYRQSYCLYTPAAWEALQRGERPGGSDD